MASTEAEDLASLAGFTVAFFNSNSELKSLFSKALAENWTGDRLLQAARSTRWFRTTSAAQREALLLKSSDPAEYVRQLREVSRHIARLTAELGYRPPAAVITAATNQAYLNRWNDDQIRNYLGKYVQTFEAAAARGQLGGTLAESLQRIRRAERDYGMPMSNATRNRFMLRIMDGTITEEHVTGWLKMGAASAFPGLADQINAGMTVREIAEPYFQAMGRLWEVNTGDVDLLDPTIRGALSVKGRDGKYSALSLSDFETRLRKDKRWLGTDNAQDGMMETGHQVLNAFGVTW